MARFSIPNKSFLRQTNQRIYDVVQTVEDAINNVSDQSNVDPTATAPAAPQPISGVSVTEAGGIHDIQITDNSPAYAGLQYGVHYSQTPDFQNYHLIDLGISQNHRANMGPGQFYWRGFSYYHPATPSVPVNHGGPVAVAVGSGTYTGPAMQPLQGFTGLYRNSTVPPIRK